MDYVVFDEVQDLLAIGTDNSNRAILLAKAISICENKEIPMVFLMPYILDPEKEFINYFTDAEFLVQKNLHLILIFFIKNFIISTLLFYSDHRNRVITRTFRQTKPHILKNQR